MQSQRTIEKIISLKTGIRQEADFIFRDPVKREQEIFNLRTLIETQIQTNQIESVCIFCKQAVAIRGRRDPKDHSTHWYFTHPYRSEECQIKTKNHLTQEQIQCIEYNGQKESQAHFDLKFLIAHFLKLEPGIISVKVDKVYKEEAISKKWRKPDILSIYNDKKIAFEIQLRTTFLSVIVGRTLFYKERNIFLIWVFENFSIDSDVQRFTEKDVYYNNNVNVYVFDQEAQSKSNADKRLTLKCFYKRYYLKHNQVKEKWEYNFIVLSELTFDNQEVFYYNSNEEKEKLELQLKENGISSKIGEVVDFLYKYYENDSNPNRENGNNPLELISTPYEINVLNSKINYTRKKADKILKLFIERKKPNYLKFICLSDNIEMDTSVTDQDGNTLFHNLLIIHDIPIFKKYITYLFRKGYKLTYQDNQDYESLFTEKKIGLIEDECLNMEKWGYIYFLKKVWSNTVVMDILRIERILFAILSLKYDRVIGYRLDNLKQVINNTYNQHPGFGRIFYGAMTTYYKDLKQFELDRQSKVREKVSNFLKGNSEQDISHNTLIYNIFNELF